MSKKRKLNVGVVFGGQSGEHEVSLQSALSVMSRLDLKKYNVIPIGINKKGRWLRGKPALELYPKKEQKYLSNKIADSENSNTKNLITLSEKKSYHFIDVIFPVLHGTYGEDGTVQGFFELAHIPYVGSGVLGSALGMDKAVQKELFAFHGMPQTKFFWFYKENFKKNKKEIIRHIIKNFRFPIFVKPANLGSSVGISKTKNSLELEIAIMLAGRYDEKILVEGGVMNIKEIECSVLGDKNPKASLPGEVIPSREFYDYRAKYLDGTSKLIIPAKLPKKIIRAIQKLSIRAFQILNLSGLARVDFFVQKNKNNIFINEVNTMPGFTSISMYPKLWEASGIPYSLLLDKLIILAQKKFINKKKLKTTYRPLQDQ